MIPENTEHKKNEWLRYVEQGQPHLLRESLQQEHPADQAAVCRLLDNGELAGLLRAMDNDQLRDLFRFLKADRMARRRVFESLPDKRRNILLGDMNPEAAAELLKPLDKKSREQFTAPLPSKQRERVREILAEQGRGVQVLMTRDVMHVRSDRSVRHVVETIRGMDHSPGRPSQIYVIDHRGLLCGQIDLHLLLHCEDQDQSLEKIMQECPLRIPADMDPMTAARRLLYYGAGSCPVVNAKNELLGALTSEAAYRVLEAEHDASMDCIGVVGGGSNGGAAPEQAPDGMRIGAALFPVFLAALAVSVILKLVFFRTASHGLLALLPWAPLWIAVNRLYYRHISMLLQKRQLEVSLGGRSRRMSVRFSMLAGVVFTAMTGAAAWLLCGTQHALVIVICAGVAWAVLLGAATAWLVLAAADKFPAPRSVFMTPAVLSLGDLCTLAGVLALFSFLL